MFTFSTPALITWSLILTAIVYGAGMGVPAVQAAAGDVWASRASWPRWQDGGGDIRDAERMEVQASHGSHSAPVRLGRVRTFLVRKWQAFQDWKIDRGYGTTEAERGLAWPEDLPLEIDNSPVEAEIVSGPDPATVLMPPVPLEWQDGGIVIPADLVEDTPKIPVSSVVHAAYPPLETLPSVSSGFFPAEFAEELIADELIADGYDHRPVSDADRADFAVANPESDWDNILESLRSGSAG